uniref:GRIP domain-containing protein n=1 Tax=Panagrolaimus sp. ES5 TaxID=591445 RepID=A0AC34FQ86_9BILA
MEIEELIRTLNNRNEKITQLTERSSYLEDELRSTQDYAKNIKGELEDAQHSLNQLRTRGLEERRRAESDYDFRLRQAYTEKEILQKQLNRTIEQSTEEKEKLIESFQRQNAELEEKNREILQQLEEYRNLATTSLAASTTPRATTPIRVTRHEYEALEKQLVHTRDLLNDMEDTNAKLAEQIKILKEEIRRLERNTEREEHAKNGEYLKNVLMKYLAPPKVNDERQQLLPVLTTMLRLSPEEVSAITGYIKESLVVSSEDNNGWTSYLWSNIV